jgi:fructose-bisphosphate aldolase class II
MLVTLESILKIAEAKKIAVGSFNATDSASQEAILRAAEELNQPVILMHAQVHEEMGLCRMEDVAPMMLDAADRASVPVCVHLDHGTDLDYVARGLKLGFTSVMYDGSALSTEENTANTAVAVELAAQYGASVEAEIGSMGAREGGGDEGAESHFTDPEAALRFVSDTGIDALACAFGTVHGLYRAAPKLDFERVEKIRSLVSVPLVMHGGSGVSDEDYRRVIDCGIRKINYYTYMAKAGAEAVAGKSFTFFHDLRLAVTEAMKQNVMSAMKVFSGIKD